MVDNSALLIVEDALRPDEIDRGALESRLKEEQSSLESAEEGSEEERRHRREIARVEAFLAIDGDGSG